MPKIAITMGDPAGIGPELVCKTLNNPDIYKKCSPVVIGSSEPIKRAIEISHLSIKLKTITDPDKGDYEFGTVCLIDIPIGYEFSPGKMDAGNGKCAIDYMKFAHKLVSEGKVDAIACAPCNKEAMHLAGSLFTGATELFAHLDGINKASTILKQGDYYLFKLTSHLSLRDALDSIDEKLVANTIRYVHSTMRGFGIKNPIIAISGINPHSGEGGLLGTEEINFLIPAIKSVKKEGICVIGPVPADIIFVKATKEKYDAIIGMFHDTMGAVSKYIAIEKPTVVITGELSFVRTTVAHGTAYDIAYKNMANHKQFEACVFAAATIVADKKRNLISNF